MNYKIIFIAILLLLGTVTITKAQTKILNGNTYEKIDSQWYQIYQGKQFEVSSTFVTVRFAQGLSENQKSNVAQLHGCTIAQTNSLGFYLLRLEEGKIAIETVEALIENDNIEIAEPNIYGEYDEHANDIYYGDQWHLKDEKITGGIDAYKA